MNSNAGPGPSASASAHGTLLVPFVSAPPRLELNDGQNLATSWRAWRQRWDAFSAVSGLCTASDEYQTGMLISAVDDETLRIVNALPYAAETDKKKLTKVLELLEKYCLQGENVMFERHRFYQRHQREGEPVERFITDLRTLAGTCGFTEDGKDFTEQMIRDRLVCGIANDGVRQRLLAKENPSLASCVKECRAFAATTSQVSEMRLTAPVRIKTEVRDTEDSRDVLKVTATAAVAPHPPVDLCRYCNRRHEKRRCPAYGQECRNCGKKNHFAVVCRRPRINMIAGSQEDERHVGTVTVTRESESLAINRVSPVDKGKLNVVYAIIHIQDRPIRFQVDSGASCNILRQEDLRSLDSNVPITRTKRSLRMYDGSTCTPLGTCTLSARNCKANVACDLEFMIVGDAQVAIIGCAASQDLGLLTVRTENIEVNSLATGDGQGRTARQLMAAYGDVFNGELGRLSGVERLETDPTVRPVKMPLRRIPFAVQDRLEEEIRHLEELGVIEQVTQPTDWVSGIVVAEKKNGALRICIDPKPLNVALRRSVYPMPTMEEVLPRLTNAKVFTVCDVKNGFWHIQLDEASSLLTTFATPYGRYKWTRLPFGVAPAPELFQRKLDECIQDLPCVARIVDDLLIWGEGETPEEALSDHDKHVENLLERARSRNLKLNPEKFNFKKTEVKFAGYILTPEGHKPDPEKVRAIVEMSPPKDVAGVRRFLGMTNYFSKYLSGLSKWCEPLRQLTSEKVEWQWAEEHDQAFKVVKRALSTAPLLAFFNNNCEDTTVQCDASQGALGAVLMQEGRPVTFASRTLSSAEENYAQIEKELLAVVYAMERFDHYTFGRHVRVESDHKPLQVILKKPMTDAPRRLQRMLLRLHRYSFDLVYTPGRELKVADALSRAPVTNSERETAAQSDLETVCTVADPRVVDSVLESLRKATESDQTMQKVKKLIKEGWPADKKGLAQDVTPYYHFRDELICEGGIVFKGDRCVVPRAMRKETLQELHRSHLGLEATLRRAREIVFWPRMSSELTDFIRRCDTCRAMDPHQQKEPLISHDIEEQVWAKVGADLFKFEDRDYLITVDYRTNFWEVDYLRNDTTSRNVIRKMKMNFSRYGIPQRLVSDNGPQFVSQEFKVFMDAWGIEHQLSSPYHPQSNGKAESAVKMAKTLMAKARHSGSDFYLMLLEYRSTPSQGLDSSPAQRMLCRTVRTRLPTKTTTLQQKPVHADKLTLQLKKAQSNQQKAYNRASKPLPPLRPGQKVRVVLNGLWRPAIVVRVAGSQNRSYVTRTLTGSYFRRNRRDIRADQAITGDDNSMGPDQEEQLSRGEISEKTCEERRTPETQQEGRDEVEEVDQGVQGEQTASDSKQTRSGRTTRRPSRWDDYHCSWK